MTNIVNDYSCWRSIDYRPAIGEVDVRTLFHHVRAGQSALDIGCNTGAVARTLARHGLSVLGVDINETAINVAKRLASDERLPSVPQFRVADVLDDEITGTFDVVVAVRILTCFPSVEEWNQLTGRIFALLRPSGIVYVNDFVLDVNSPIYRERYATGSTLGWREGNFSVEDNDGNIVFVAHHHSDTDIVELVSRYGQVEQRFYDSLSMNGNPCRMFEFIGRKTSKMKV